MEVSGRSLHLLKIWGKLLLFTKSGKGFRPSQMCGRVPALSSDLKKISELYEGLGKVTTLYGILRKLLSFMKIGECYYLTISEKCPSLSQMSGEVPFSLSMSVDGIYLSEWQFCTSSYFGVYKTTFRHLLITYSCIHKSHSMTKQKIHLLFN